MLFRRRRGRREVVKRTLTSQTTTISSGSQNNLSNSEEDPDTAVTLALPTYPSRPSGSSIRNIFRRPSSLNVSSAVSVASDVDVDPDVDEVSLCGYDDHTDTKSNDIAWTKPYEPPPVVSQSTILSVGFCMFVLAIIWPPLLLLFTYVASKLIPYSFRVNDDASKRRQLFAQFVQNASYHHERFLETPEHIQLEESYWINDRGMALATVTMTPKNQPIKAVVCFCHGYTDNVSYMKKVENMRLVEQGIAFCALEIEGHGRSDGPLGLINDWNRMIRDISTYFQQLSTTDVRFQGKPFFLMGESMGGAVAYSIYNRIPDLFRGVVFVCPMCKIGDDMLPPQWIIDLLQWLIGPTGTTSFLGFLPIAPAKNDVGNVSYRIEKKREVVSRCPTSFCRNPRLATARELIQVTKDISASLKEFDAPFLVVHGEADRVTDPQLSQALYNESKSTDKSIILYPGMWHALTLGEPDESIDLVYNDCIKWILDRSNSEDGEGAR